MLADLERELSSARLDPVAFFGPDPDTLYRWYAVRLHPDRFPERDRDRAARLFRELGALKAAASQAPLQVVTLPTREYSVRSTLGRGDLCDVQYATSDGQAYLLKTPYVTLPAANNLLAKEREVLEHLHEQAAGTSTYSHYLPLPVESFLVGKVRVNVFHRRPGLFTTADVLTKHAPLDSRHLAWMFKRMLTVLGFAHRYGWAHCAVLPQHCLWSAANHGLVLCDWIHAAKLGSPVPVVPSSHKAWYPGKEATPALDIHLAARTLVQMAGGEEALPPLMRGFMRSCCLPGRLAPSDAWQLCAEFTDLLDQLFGPPVFVPLDM